MSKWAYDANESLRSDYLKKVIAELTAKFSNVQYVMPSGPQPLSWIGDGAYRVSNWPFVFLCDGQEIRVELPADLEKAVMQSVAWLHETKSRPAGVLPEAYEE